VWSLAWRMTENFEQSSVENSVCPTIGRVLLTNSGVFRLTTGKVLVSRDRRFLFDNYKKASLGQQLKSFTEDRKIFARYAPFNQRKPRNSKIMTLRFAHHSYTRHFFELSQLHWRRERAERDEIRGRTPVWGEKRRKFPPLHGSFTRSLPSMKFRGHYFRGPR
jgi:hypothetical protein